MTKYLIWLILIKKYNNVLYEEYYTLSFYLYLNITKMHKNLIKSKNS